MNGVWQTTTKGDGDEDTRASFSDSFNGKFSVKDIVTTGCWMENDRTVLLPIKKDWDAPTANYEIYRYDLVSRQLTNLTNQPGGDYGPHWIRGSLAVVPAEKLTILWGQLEQTD